jgi:hypothetical protein
MNAGYLGRQKKFDAVPYAGWMYTNLGLVVRNMEQVLPEHFETIYWRDCLKWSGIYLEDSMICYPPLQFGYHTAKIYRNPTHHYHVVTGTTQEDYERSRRVPSHCKHYFPWKVDARREFFTTEYWQQCEDFKFLTNLLGIGSNPILSYEDIST